MSPVHGACKSCSIADTNNPQPGPEVIVMWLHTRLSIYELTVPQALQIRIVQSSPCKINQTPRQRGGQRTPRSWAIHFQQKDQKPPRALVIIGHPLSTRVLGHQHGFPHRCATWSPASNVSKKLSNEVVCVGEWTRPSSAIRLQPHTSFAAPSDA